MNPVLNQNLFFVKEHIGIFKASSNYDIFDPQTQEMIMTCRESKLSLITKILRFTDLKRMTPFNIEVRDAQGQKIISIKRATTFFLSKVEVFDEKDELIGKFKQKLFSIGGKFDILNPNDEIICQLKGKWTSWDFKFVKGNQQFAQVNKKWAGIGKELFTTADNYILQIDENVAENHMIRQLILGAVMCIDMVLKE